MYGDSHALSSDSIPISPSTPNPSKQEGEHQFPLMESQYSNSTQNSSGLLRFRSAPTSLLSNFTEKSSKLGFSRFCSDETNGVMNVAGNEEEDDGDEDDGCNNNKGGSFSRFGAVNSQLPPQYPRQSGSGGYRVVSSIGRENQGLMRQNSSPAGLFSHLNSQNGTFFFLMNFVFAPILICCISRFLLLLFLLVQDLRMFSVLAQNRSGGYVVWTFLLISDRAHLGKTRFFCVF